MKNNWMKWVLPGVAVLILDRLVKWAAENGLFFDALRGAIRNSGMAFGWFQGKAGTILLFSLALVAVCLFLLRSTRISGLAPIALSLIAGGALGNMIDRLANGYVIDMFPFFGWFVFNVADAGVVAGVALCAFSLLFRPQDWSKA